MLNKYIYALVDYGYYDWYSFVFIKLNKKDKNKFISYCKDSQLINGDGIETLNLLCWAYDVELFKYSYRVTPLIITIQQHQRFIEDIISNSTLEVEPNLNKLLNYVFIDV